MLLDALRLTLTANNTTTVKNVYLPEPNCNVTYYK
jgi:hypothetical protein